MKRISLYVLFMSGAWPIKNRYPFYPLDLTIKIPWYFHAIDMKYLERK